MVRLLLVAIALLPFDGPTGFCAELPLFDAHIHYNQDVWESVPPEEAIARLRQAGVLRALVSSTSDEGTQRLYAQAPDLIIPELRPYRRHGETATWFHDESVLPYLQERLNTHAFVALGEFHISGADADLPVVRHVVQLARQHHLMLHAHSDADAVERLFRQDPDARIIWAHGGYESPSGVAEMLHRHDNLWVELSSRDDLAVTGHLVQDWRDIFMEFPTRFMVGTDTHAPDRWNVIGFHGEMIRAWLADLPEEVARRIAFQNGEALLTETFKMRR